MTQSPSELSFTKMQGVGNDFVLIDGREFSGIDWSGLAQNICDRRFGLGADGLLVIDQSNIADAAMRMYNPDGTPDFCGNGIRCVVRYLADRRIEQFQQGRSIEELPHHVQHPSLPPRTYRAGEYQVWKIATLAGIKEGRLFATSDEQCLVTIGMGHAKLAPADIPMLVSGERVVDYPLKIGEGTIHITSLSTGTTHTVIFVDELPDDSEFFTVSPLIETHELYPERTSVLWTRVEKPGKVHIRIWERGAGETWGCGTGACAVAEALKLHGKAETVVQVLSKGGRLLITWEKDGSIQMNGPAEYVFTGTYSF